MNRVYVSRDSDFIFDIRSFPLFIKLKFFAFESAVFVANWISRQGRICEISIGTGMLTKKLSESCGCMRCNDKMIVSTFLGGWGSLLENLWVAWSDEIARTSKCLWNSWPNSWAFSTAFPRLFRANKVTVRCNLGERKFPRLLPCLKLLLRLCYSRGTHRVKGGGESVETFALCRSAEPEEKHLLRQLDSKLCFSIGVSFSQLEILAAEDLSGDLLWKVVFPDDEKFPNGYFTIFSEDNRSAVGLE